MWGWGQAFDFACEQAGLFVGWSVSSVNNAAHKTRTTHITTRTPTINKKTYPAIYKYHSVITQVLALFHKPTDSLIQVSPFYFLPQIVISHTGKTLHGISQHGTPTTVKRVMTPKGAQLNNHAQTHPHHTCPGA